MLLNTLWFIFTWKAFSCAKAWRFAEHKDYMIRSYALTFSALTLRMWKLILSHLIVIDLTELYVIDAWLAFIPNLIIAEILIRLSKIPK